MTMRESVSEFMHVCIMRERMNQTRVMSEYQIHHITLLTRSRRMYSHTICMSICHGSSL